jgi:chitin-binding protein
MKERGSALLTVVISIIVLSLISGIFFSTVVSNVKVVNSEEKGLIAYSLAEAGIQYGLGQLLHNEFKAGDDFPPPESIPDPFGNGGSFSIEWVEIPEEDSFMLVSTGTYDKVTRVKTAGLTFGTGDGEGSGGAGGGSEPGDETPPAFPDWEPSKRYLKDDHVVYSTVIDGKSAERLFYARWNGAVGDKPGDLNTPWQEITNYFRTSNFYELGKNGNIVYHNSSYWQMRWNNYGSGHEPGKNSEPSNAMWRELIDDWRPYESYPAKEVVSYQGNRYRVKWNNPPGPPNSADPYGPWELLNNSVRTLQRISISPDNPSFRVGEQIVFTATAHFSDGSTEDVTSKATWSSTYPQIASISGNVATGVMDTGVEECNSALISASYTYTYSYSEGKGKGKDKDDDIVINRVGVTELEVASSTGNEGGGSALIIWEKEIPPDEAP